ncbi:MAG: hypothetical protein Q8Q33_01010, partial [Chlamydiota bacterium]|nr:hypothetical protein [Chlamydiota bacterium]
GDGATYNTSHTEYTRDDATGDITGASGTSYSQVSVDHNITKSNTVTDYNWEISNGARADIKHSHTTEPDNDTDYTDIWYHYDNFPDKCQGVPCATGLVHRETNEDETTTITTTVNQTFLIYGGKTFLDDAESTVLTNGFDTGGNPYTTTLYTSLSGMAHPPADTIYYDNINATGSSASGSYDTWGSGGTYTTGETHRNINATDVIDSRTLIIHYTEAGIPDHQYWIARETDYTTTTAEGRLYYGGYEESTTYYSCSEMDGTCLCEGPCYTEDNPEDVLQDGENPPFGGKESPEMPYGRDENPNEGSGGHGNGGEEEGGTPQTGESGADINTRHMGKVPFPDEAPVSSENASGNLANQGGANDKGQNLYFQNFLTTGGGILEKSVPGDRPAGISREQVTLWRDPENGRVKQIQQTNLSGFYNNGNGSRYQSKQELTINVDIGGLVRNASGQTFVRTQSALGSETTYVGKQIFTPAEKGSLRLFSDEGQLTHTNQNGERFTQNSYFSLPANPDSQNHFGQSSAQGWTFIQGVDQTGQKFEFHGPMITDLINDRANIISTASDTPKSFNLPVPPDLSVYETGSITELTSPLSASKPDNKTGSVAVDKSTLTQTLLETKEQSSSLTKSDVQESVLAKNIGLESPLASDGTPQRNVKSLQVHRLQINQDAQNRNVYQKEPAIDKDPLRPSLQESNTQLMRSGFASIMGAFRETAKKIMSRDPSDIVRSAEGKKTFQKEASNALAQVMRSRDVFNADSAIPAVPMRTSVTEEKGLGTITGSKVSTQGATNVPIAYDTHLMGEVRDNQGQLTHGLKSFVDKQGHDLGTVAIDVKYILSQDEHGAIDEKTVLMTSKSNVPSMVEVAIKNKISPAQLTQTINTGKTLQSVGINAFMLNNAAKLVDYFENEKAKSIDSKLQVKEKGEVISQIPIDVVKEGLTELISVMSTGFNTQQVSALKQSYKQMRMTGFSQQEIKECFQGSGKNQSASFTGNLMREEMQSGASSLPSNAHARFGTSSYGSYEGRDMTPRTGDWKQDELYHERGEVPSSDVRQTGADPMPAGFQMINWLGGYPGEGGTKFNSYRIYRDSQGHMTGYRNETIVDGVFYNQGFGALQYADMHTITETHFVKDAEGRVVESHTITTEVGQRSNMAGDIEQIDRKIETVYEVTAFDVFDNPASFTKTTTINDYQEESVQVIKEVQIATLDASGRMTSFTYHSTDVTMDSTGAIEKIITTDKTVTDITWDSIGNMATFNELTHITAFEKSDLMGGQMWKTLDLTTNRVQNHATFDAKGRLTGYDNIARTTGFDMSVGSLADGFKVDKWEKVERRNMTYTTQKVNGEDKDLLAGYDEKTTNSYSDVTTEITMSDMKYDIQGRLQSYTSTDHLTGESTQSGPLNYINANLRAMYESNPWLQQWFNADGSGKKGTKWHRKTLVDWAQTAWEEHPDLLSEYGPGEHTITLDQTTVTHAKMFYSEDGRLAGKQESIRDLNSPNLTTERFSSFSYDAAGNMTASKVDTHSYGYDPNGNGPGEALHIDYWTTKVITDISYYANGMRSSYTEISTDANGKTERKVVSGIHYDQAGNTILYTGTENFTAEYNRLNQATTTNTDGNITYDMQYYENGQLAGFSVVPEEGKGEINIYNITYNLLGLKSGQMMDIDVTQKQKTWKSTGTARQQEQRSYTYTYNSLGTETEHENVLSKHTDSHSSMTTMGVIVTIIVIVIAIIVTIVVTYATAGAGTTAVIGFWAMVIGGMVGGIVTAILNYVVNLSTGMDKQDALEQFGTECAIAIVAAFITAGVASMFKPVAQQAVALTAKEVAIQSAKRILLQVVIPELFGDELEKLGTVGRALVMGLISYALGSTHTSGNGTTIIFESAIFQFNQEMAIALTNICLDAMIDKFIENNYTDADGNTTQEGQILKSALSSALTSLTPLVIRTWSVWLQGGKISTNEEGKVEVQWNDQSKTIYDNLSDFIADIGDNYDASGNKTGGTTVVQDSNGRSEHVTYTYAGGDHNKLLFTNRKGEEVGTMTFENGMGVFTASESWGGKSFESASLNINSGNVTIRQISINVESELLSLSYKDGNSQIQTTIFASGDALKTETTFNENGTTKSIITTFSNKEGVVIYKSEKNFDANGKFSTQDVYVDDQKVLHISKGVDGVLKAKGSLYEAIKASGKENVFVNALENGKLEINVTPMGIEIKGMELDTGENVSFKFQATSDSRVGMLISTVETLDKKDNTTTFRSESFDVLKSGTEDREEYIEVRCDNKDEIISAVAKLKGIDGELVIFKDHKLQIDNVQLQNIFGLENIEAFTAMLGEADIKSDVTFDANGFHIVAKKGDDVKASLNIDSENQSYSVGYIDDKGHTMARTGKLKLAGIFYHPVGLMAGIKIPTGELLYDNENQIESGILYHPLALMYGIKIPIKLSYEKSVNLSDLRGIPTFLTGANKDGDLDYVLVEETNVGSPLAGITLMEDGVISGDFRRLFEDLNDGDASSGDFMEAFDFKESPIAFQILGETAFRFIRGGREIRVQGGTATLLENEQYVAVFRLEKSKESIVTSVLTSWKYEYSPEGKLLGYVQEVGFAPKVKKSQKVDCIYFSDDMGIEFIQFKVNGEATLPIPFSEENGDKLVFQAGAAAVLNNQNVRIGSFALSGKIEEGIRKLFIQSETAVKDGEGNTTTTQSQITMHFVLFEDGLGAEIIPQDQTSPDLIKGKYIPISRYTETNNPDGTVQKDIETVGAGTSSVLYDRDGEQISANVSMDPTSESMFKGKTFSFQYDPKTQTWSMDSGGEMTPEQEALLLSKMNEIKSDFSMHVNEYGFQIGGKDAQGQELLLIVSGMILDNPEKTRDFSLTVRENNKTIEVYDTKCEQVWDNEWDKDELLSARYKGREVKISENQESLTIIIAGVTHTIDLARDQREMIFAVGGFRVFDKNTGQSRFDFNGSVIQAFDADGNIHLLSSLKDHLSAQFSDDMMRASVTFLTEEGTSRTVQVGLSQLRETDPNKRISEAVKIIGMAVALLKEKFKLEKSDEKAQAAFATAKENYENAKLPSEPASSKTQKTAFIDAALSYARILGKTSILSQLHNSELEVIRNFEGQLMNLSLPLCTATVAKLRAHTTFNNFLRTIIDSSFIEEPNKEGRIGYFISLPGITIELWSMEVETQSVEQENVKRGGYFQRIQTAHTSPIDRLEPYIETIVFILPVIETITEVFTTGLKERTERTSIFPTGDTATFIFNISSLLELPENILIDALSAPLQYEVDTDGNPSGSDTSSGFSFLRALYNLEEADAAYEQGNYDAAENLYRESITFTSATSANYANEKLTNPEYADNNTIGPFIRDITGQRDEAGNEIKPPSKMYSKAMESYIKGFALLAEGRTHEAEKSFNDAAVSFGSQFQVAEKQLAYSDMKKNLYLAFNAFLARVGIKTIAFESLVTASGLETEQMVLFSSALQSMDLESSLVLNQPGAAMDVLLHEFGFNDISSMLIVMNQAFKTGEGEEMPAQYQTLKEAFKNKKGANPTDFAMYVVALYGLSQVDVEIEKTVSALENGDIDSAQLHIADVQIWQELTNNLKQGIDTINDDNKYFIGNELLLGAVIKERLVSKAFDFLSQHGYDDKSITTLTEIKSIIAIVSVVEIARGEGTYLINSIWGSSLNQELDIYGKEIFEALGISGQWEYAKFRLEEIEKLREKRDAFSKNDGDHKSEIADIDLQISQKQTRIDGMIIAALESKGIIVMEKESKRESINKEKLIALGLKPNQTSMLFGLAAGTLVERSDYDIAQLTNDQALPAHLKTLMDQAIYGTDSDLIHGLVDIKASKATWWQRVERSWSNLFDQHAIYRIEHLKNVSRHMEEGGVVGYAAVGLNYVKYFVWDCGVKTGMVNTVGKFIFASVIFGGAMKLAGSAWKELESIPDPEVKVIILIIKAIFRNKIIRAKEIFLGKRDFAEFSDMERFVHQYEVFLSTQPEVVQKAKELGHALNRGQEIGLRISELKAVLKPDLKKLKEAVQELSDAENTMESAILALEVSQEKQNLQFSRREALDNLVEARAVGMQGVSGLLYIDNLNYLSRMSTLFIELSVNQDQDSLNKARTITGEFALFSTMHRALIGHEKEKIGLGLIGDFVDALRDVATLGALYKEKTIRQEYFNKLTGELIGHLNGKMLDRNYIQQIIGAIHISDLKIQDIKKTADKNLGIAVIVVDIAMLVVSFITLGAAGIAYNMIKAVVLRAAYALPKFLLRDSWRILIKTTLIKSFGEEILTMGFRDMMREVFIKTMGKAFEKKLLRSGISKAIAQERAAGFSQGIRNSLVAAKETAIKSIGGAGGNIFKIGTAMREAESAVMNVFITKATEAFGESITQSFVFRFISGRLTKSFVREIAISQEIGFFMRGLVKISSPFVTVGRFFSTALNGLPDQGIVRTYRELGGGISKIYNDSGVLG